MAYSSQNTAAIRDLLIAAFSDEELTTLCFDHFRTVYDNFSSDMSKGHKIQLLLDYCTRYERIDSLLKLVQERNPEQYARFASRLQTTGSAPRSTEASTTSINGGVNIQSERVDIGGDVVGRDKVEIGGDFVGRDKISIILGDGQRVEPRDLSPTAITPGPERDEAHLRRQLAEAEANLKLIRERKSQYVLEVDIPLQLIKEERNLLERITELKRQLGE